MVKKLSEMKPGEVGTVVAINGFGNIKNRLYQERLCAL